MRFRLFFFVPAIVVSLLFAAQIVRAEDNWLFVDEPLPPYSCGNVGERAKGGISYMLVKEIFKRMDMEARLELVPWARALKMLEYGRADGMPLLLPNGERAAFMVFTDPILEGGDALVYNIDRHPDFVWRGYESLQGLTLGLVRGYSYNTDLFRAMLEHAGGMEFSVDSEANLRKLQAGRVDVVIEELLTVRTILSKHEDWKPALRVWPELLTSYYWSMGISKKSRLAERLEEINAVLGMMREEGTLSKITSSDGWCQ